MFAEEVRNILAADVTLQSYLSTRIYLWRDLPRPGFSRTSAPTSWDANGVLQPTMIVRGPNLTPAGGISGSPGPVASVEQFVALWIYDDGNIGFDTILLAEQRAFSLLHLSRLGVSGGQCFYTGRGIGRAEELNDAARVRAEYQCVGILR